MKTKNFEDFYNTNEKFDVINNDLKSEIKEYLLTEYPSDWWQNEFMINLDNYITEDDIVGNGDSDDESTWDYESSEEAYTNLCTGGAIEYDCLNDIRTDIRKKFHLSDEEYDRNKIGDIVETHMCNMIDWYDHSIFGEKGGDFLGMRDNINKMMSRWDSNPDFDELPTEIKTDDGRNIKL